MHFWTASNCFLRLMFYMKELKIMSTSKVHIAKYVCNDSIMMITENKINWTTKNILATIGWIFQTWFFSHEHTYKSSLLFKFSFIFPVCTSLTPRTRKPSKTVHFCHPVLFHMCSISQSSSLSESQEVQEWQDSVSCQLKKQHSNTVNIHTQS